MDKRVSHPGAAQVRPPLLIGDGGGIFPGRLPFIDPIADERLLCPCIRTKGGKGFRGA
jgi:hypothetical protein